MLGVCVRVRRWVEGSGMLGICLKVMFVSQDPGLNLLCLFGMAGGVDHSLVETEGTFTSLPAHLHPHSWTARG